MFKHLIHTGQEMVYRMRVGIGSRIETQCELLTDCAETSVFTSYFSHNFKFMRHLSLMLLSIYITLYISSLLVVLFAVLQGALTVHQRYIRGDVGAYIPLLVTVIWMLLSTFGPDAC
jgi:hypothetical protein